MWNPASIISFIAFCPSTTNKPCSYLNFFWANFLISAISFFVICRNYLAKLYV